MRPRLEVIAGAQDTGPVQGELVCPRCHPLELENAGLRTALQSLQQQLDEQATEIAGLQLQLRRAGQAEVALRNKIKQMTEDPDRKENETVRTILELHRRVTQVRQSKKPVDMASDAADLVRKQLKRYSPEALMEAIQGKALRPYFRNYNHYPTGPGQRQATMRHCIGTDEWIARNREWWEQAQVVAMEDRESMFRAWQQAEATAYHWGRLLLGAALAREAGVSLEEGMVRRDEIAAENTMKEAA